ncbi:M14 family metallopeptidase [Pedobacter nutrimenti]|jgi:hypothetical protein|uniref:Zinc carboxypeptidase n=1 Tax=Pedobacter nutrimenti TaxID=1241337 RepID=A0A318UIU4_9SPHI|nr:M14 family metallopeptidase [Pedobacter nutrimenti]PYF75891.1 zinc carboxypeptidase [Pedobacter nutrimenti]
MESFAQQTPFEISGGQQTATYPEVIRYYHDLAAHYPQAKLITYGKTDFGEPLHLLVLSKDKEFNPQTLRQQHKRIFLINNGIHPGEPEGIDACMMLSRDLLKENRLPKDVVICIIPLYNIDGSYNRTSTSRANQNGPLFYGFRGNSRNYDLNRDFIKTDSKNSESFQYLFNSWQPEIFVDTHTSNGADYQYTMTLIPTQKDKLQPILSAYLCNTMLPDLYTQMKKKGFELIPYVNSVEETPESGIEGFLETPRFSTGYTTLHNTIGFMPETHMLKPYDKRVESTYKLLETYIELIVRDAKIIGENKAKADLAVARQKEFTLSWKLDKSTYDQLPFKGFEAKYKPSEVSGLNRLYYDRNAPYTRNIKQWNNFVPEVTVSKPLAYVIPKAWTRVIELLKLNQVHLQQLQKDTELDLNVYYIKDYKTASKPFEGHYLHSQVQVTDQQQKIKFYAGDYVVYVNQAQNRYIVETLEPQATDSFFNWNFFDAVLGQKEHYSAYVFEDTAAELLKHNPELKNKLEQQKASQKDFAENPAAQLEFIYKNSDYYEKTHLRYPIARLEQNVNLSLK